MFTSIDMAITSGVLATFAGIAVFLVWYLTEKLAPVERRAWRVGIAGGVLCGVLVGLVEAWLYADVDATVGAFMLMPSLVLGMVAMRLGGRRVYRALGGGQDEASESTPSPVPDIEPETLEHQSELWCRLRELPHMRETLSGELINLATGDRIYWTRFRNERCIEMLLAGKTPLTASRYETLTKYLAVQKGIAGLLASSGASQWPPL